VVLGFTGGPEPYNGASIWMSQGIYHQWNPKQTKPATPGRRRIDKIFVDGAKLTDVPARKKLYDRFQEILGEQQPMIFLVNAKP